MTTTTLQKPGAGLRRWGKILSIVGGIILALSVIAGAIMAVSGLGTAMESASEAQQFSGTTSVTLESGEAVQLYVPTGGGMPPACSVSPEADVGPGPDQSSTLTMNGRKWSSFDGFSATADGTYEITCVGYEGPPEVLVSPPVSTGGIFAGVGGILLGVLGGGLGLLLLAAGLIMFFIGRSQGKKAAAA